MNQALSRSLWPGKVSVDISSSFFDFNILVWFTIATCWWRRSISTCTMFFSGVWHDRLNTHYTYTSPPTGLACLYRHFQLFLHCHKNREIFINTSGVASIFLQMEKKNLFKNICTHVDIASESLDSSLPPLVLGMHKLCTTQHSKILLFLGVWLNCSQSTSWVQSPWKQMVYIPGGISSQGHWADWC